MNYHDPKGIGVLHHFYKWDHKPSFNFNIEILNLCLFSLLVYNINHINDD